MYSKLAVKMFWIGPGVNVPAFDFGPKIERSEYNKTYTQRSYSAAFLPTTTRTTSTKFTNIKHTPTNAVQPVSRLSTHSPCHLTAHHQAPSQPTCSA
jgi:hypothetical protein